MARRHYSNIAVATTLVSGIDASDTSLVVADATGFPQAPFALMIDEGTADQEVILVGSKSGTNFLGLTRAFDGTVAKQHLANAAIVHVVIALDLDTIFAHSHAGPGADDSALISHLDLVDAGPDEHHEKTHLHDGADGSGVVSHPSLTNITTDDHHDILHIHDGFDGSGQVDHDSLINIGPNDHHDEDHATRHAIGGADALTSGVPSVSTPGDSASEGVGSGFSRNDHKHGREAGKRVVVRKTAGEEIFSTTTFQNDDHLFFAIGANEVWVFTFFVMYSSPAAADIKMRVVGPTGYVTRHGWEVRLDTSDALFPFSVQVEETTGIPFGADITRRHIVIDGIIINAGVAGNCQLQWAQNVSNVGTTAVEMHSYLVAHSV